VTPTVMTDTLTNVAAMGLTATFGVVVTLALIVLLVAKQLTAAGTESQAIKWTRTLNIGIVPLLLGFAVIVGLKFSTLG
jgi:hypothetical protein